MFIVMTAPGCYGNYATVYSRHETLEGAISAARRHAGRAIVSTDGGNSDNHQPGATIHRSFAEGYEILWSRRQGAA